MPLWIIIPSIVLMQSFNSCTRAFNRAQLINYLPREKIATYMTGTQVFQILDYVTLYYIVLYYITSYYIIFFLLYYIVLHYIILYYIILYSILVYSIIFNRRCRVPPATRMCACKQSGRVQGSKGVRKM